MKDYRLALILNYVHSTSFRSGSAVAVSARPPFELYVP